MSDIPSIKTFYVEMFKQHPGDQASYRNTRNEHPFVKLKIVHI